MSNRKIREMRIVPASLLVMALTACGSGGGNGFGGFSISSSRTTSDHGIDSGALSEMRAGIWVDPNGCDHWIIDDGVEGYLTPRLAPDGRPVCREGAVPGSVSGEFEQVLIGTN